MKRAVVMLSVHNEADFIGEVIENLLCQDLVVVALDNGSDDGAYDVCRRFHGRGVLTLERWEPEGIDLDRLTRALFRLAMAQQPDWLLWSDGDELLQTLRPHRTLRSIIDEADTAGSNLMQFDRFDFFMTRLDDEGEPSPRRRLRHYSWQGDFNYRAWKHYPGTSAWPSLAHYPILPEGVRYRIYAEKQVLRHYPYRNPAQADGKLATLLSKFPTDPARLHNWQRRYVRLAEEGRCGQPAPADRLVRYRGDHRWGREPHYTPFISPQPTRDEWFTPDGRLAYPPPPTIPLDAP